MIIINILYIMHIVLYVSFELNVQNYSNSTIKIFVCFFYAHCNRIPSLEVLTWDALS